MAKRVKTLPTTETIPKTRTIVLDPLSSGCFCVPFPGWEFVVFVLLLGPGAGVVRLAAVGNGSVDCLEQSAPSHPERQ